MLIASALSNVQSAFVIGHELGHVLLGHLREYRVAGPPEHPHEMEFAADLRGAELVLNGYGYSRGVIADRDAELGQAGIDMFFTYMIFMEAVLGRREDEFSSHPSSKDRRQKLRDRYLRGLPESARQLAGAAEKLFEAFAETAAKKQTK
jgi:Zn-dependent protease with chaperone function